MEIFVEIFKNFEFLIIKLNYKLWNNILNFRKRFKDKIR